MLDFDLIRNVLIVAIGSSIIATAFVQKVKEAINFKKSSRLVLVSFVSSMILGTLFSLSYSDTSFIHSLWVGLFSFIGADALYKAFENKLFKPFSEIVEQNKEIVKKENIIK